MELGMRGKEEVGYGKGFDLDTFEVEPGGDAEGVRLGDEEGEVVKGKGKSGVGDDKAVVALKNHSEAERRRRVRINGHLDVLRDLLCSNEKMDKASLLAEAINQVKDLQDKARHVSKGLLIPFDSDELMVELEPLHNESNNGVITFKATLCCDFRPDIFSDLKHAFRSLNLKTLHAEMSTLEDRVKTLFILASRNNDTTENLRKAIRQTLSNVVSKPSTLPEYSRRTNLSNKRFKTPLEDYSPRSVLSNNILVSSLEARQLNIDPSDSSSVP